VAPFKPRRSVGRACFLRRVALVSNATLTRRPSSVRIVHRPRLLSQPKPNVAWGQRLPIAHCARTTKVSRCPLRKSKRPASEQPGQRSGKSPTGWPTQAKGRTTMTPIGGEATAYDRPNEPSTRPKAHPCEEDAGARGHEHTSFRLRDCPIRR